MINIRPLKPGDRQEIENLLRETSVFTDEEINVALELIDTALEDASQKDYQIYTGVGTSGEVLGYFCVGPTPLTAGTYDLYWIAVKPAVHDRGIGRQLLVYAEKMVAGQGGRLLVAQTSSQPKYEHTRNFYLKNRYGELARIRDYYKIGDDLVIYGKYVPQLGES